MTLLLSVWDDFQNWVTLKWSDTTYIIIVCALAVVGLWALLQFFKGSINKEKKPKWGILVLSLVMFALLAVIFMARYI